MTRIFEQFLWVAALAMGALLAVSPAVAADSHTDICRYFTGDAFRDSRTSGETTFRMDLAQDCAAAAFYARSEDAGARDRARRYLRQLADYRAVMIDMLLARHAERSNEDGEWKGHIRPVAQPLSGAGAYLIARQMGLVATHEDWTEWRESVASAGPPVGLD